MAVASGRSWRRRAGRGFAAPLRLGELFRAGPMSSCRAGSRRRFRTGASNASDGRLNASSGEVQIDDKDMPPIRVETASADASWNEAGRALALSGLAFTAGATRVRLQGALTATDQGWRAVLAGRDAVLSGASAARPSGSGRRHRGQRHRRRGRRLRGRAARHARADARRRTERDAADAGGSGRRQHRHPWNRGRGPHRPAPVAGGDRGAGAPLSWPEP